MAILVDLAKFLRHYSQPQDYLSTEIRLGLTNFTNEGWVICSTLFTRCCESRDCYTLLHKCESEKNSENTVINVHTGCSNKLQSSTLVVCCPMPQMCKDPQRMLWALEKYGYRHEWHNDQLWEFKHIQWGSTHEQEIHINYQGPFPESLISTPVHNHAVL